MYYVALVIIILIGLIGMAMMVYFVGGEIISWFKKDKEASAQCAVEKSEECIERRPTSDLSQICNHPETKSDVSG